MIVQKKKKKNQKQKKRKKIKLNQENNEIFDKESRLDGVDIIVR